MLSPNFYPTNARNICQQRIRTSTGLVHGQQGPVSGLPGRRLCACRARSGPHGRPLQLAGLSDDGTANRHVRSVCRTQIGERASEVDHTRAGGDG